MDISSKILSDLKLDYDVNKDLKKMKENIIVFELCKIYQLREMLCKSLQHIQGSQDVTIGNMIATPEGINVKANKAIKTSSVVNTSVDDTSETIDDKNKGDP